MIAIAIVLISSMSGLVSAGVSGAYVTTCHNQEECGSVCGQYSDDILAPTEGLFGTSCHCSGDGSTTQKCTYKGDPISVCSNYIAPSCSTACGQKVCITKDGKKATATILSACPKHHPQNVQQCCDYQNDAWCTCTFQDTLDLNAKPYQELGNDNGYATSAVWGACSSQLEGLQIEINSTRATDLVQPFLVDGSFCEYRKTEFDIQTDIGCSMAPDEESCGKLPGCTFCKSTYPRVKTNCFDVSEAKVLKHIVSVEMADYSFVCDV